MDLSVQLDHNLLHKVESELENLYAIIDGYNAISTIQEAIPAEAQDSPFWKEILTSLTSLFVINWCKLFGIDSNENYWKQATLEQKAFRDDIYEKTSFNYQSWNQYRHAMHELKNELVQHLTPYHQRDNQVDLKPAYLVAACCHRWLNQVLADFSIEASGAINNPDYPEQSLKDAKENLASLNQTNKP